MTRAYEHYLAAQQFGKNARDGTEICRHLEDGSMRVMLPPSRTKDFRWHRPERFLDESQWHFNTGVTRWEFERQQTPSAQRIVFNLLAQKVKLNPPKLPSPELWAQVEAARERNPDMRLASGLPGEDLGRDLHDKLRSYLHEAYSPDGQWRFLVQAVQFGPNLIADRLDVRHRDYRTVADWTLLCRFRAFVLDDDRDAFLFMPGQDPGREGWEHRYENATPNNLAIISPRWVREEPGQPSGILALQSEFDEEIVAEALAIARSVWNKSPNPANHGQAERLLARMGYDADGQPFEGERQDDPGEEA